MDDRRNISGGQMLATANTYDTSPRELNRNPPCLVIGYPTFMGQRLYRIAYEEALRALRQQQEALEGLRARSGNIIAAAAIATSFLGGIAVPQEGLTYGVWVALVAFILLLLLCLMVLLPLPMWSFEMDAKAVIGMIESEQPLDESAILRTLAWYTDESYDENLPRLNLLHGMFIIAGMLLIVEILHGLL
jgi:hypothetical protein